MANGDTITQSFFHSTMEKIRAIIDGQFKDMKDTNDKAHTAMQEDIKENRTTGRLRDETTGKLAQDLAIVKNDVNWLKRFFWIVAGSSVGALIASVANLILS